MDNHKYIFRSDSGDLKKKCMYNFGDNLFEIKQTVTDSYCLET